jgi:hypothetical protein
MRAWHMQHLGTTGCGETVGGSTCSAQRGLVGSTKMIIDGCSYANCKV